MPDKKLTDNEIIKIKKRLKDIVEENELEYFHSNTMGWYPEIRLAYMAIKHLQAENERLKENLNIELENYATEYDNKIKAEAYKEFAERLKEKESEYNADGFYCIKYIPRKEVDNLLKELVGDTNV